MNIDSKQLEPKRTIIIDQEQFELIKLFAYTFTDNELNKTYRLNSCDFTVYPIIEVKEITPHPPAHKHELFEEEERIEEQSK